MVTNDDDDIDYDDDDDDGEDNENDRVGPQHVRLKVHGGFATLLNDLLQPAVHVLFPVLVLKARAVPEMSVYILVELIGAHLTEAEHAEVVELEGPGAISPELLVVHLVSRWSSIAGVPGRRRARPPCRPRRTCCPRRRSPQCGGPCPLRL